MGDELDQLSQSGAREIRRKQSVCAAHSVETHTTTLTKTDFDQITSSKNVERRTEISSWFIIQKKTAWAPIEDPDHEAGAAKKTEEETEISEEREM